jgi:hypothetical protein
MTPSQLSLPFGKGGVVLADDGAVAAVRHPDGRPLLLEETADAPESRFHDSTRRWGKGFIIANGLGYRFDWPRHLVWRPRGVDLDYTVGPLTLHVQREIGNTWTETYILTNTSDTPTDLGSWAISTPWRDVYASSLDSLHRAVHAHLWTGGGDAWVMAQPMDGSEPILGLILTAGELWAYTVESRDEFTSSNIRGHLYLHVTDRCRAPHTLGGQPRLILQPGEEYRLSWTLAWYASVQQFRSQQTPSLAATRYTAEVGESITLQVSADVTPVVPEAITSPNPGLHYVDAIRAGRRSRIAVFFHPPVREIAERRAHFLLARQRSSERPGTLRYAFLPYDTRWQMTVLPGAWKDWSDGRERIGAAMLLQQLRRLGWGDAGTIQSALDGYRRFITDHLLDDDGTVRDTTLGRGEPRLYNFPWFARFLFDEGDLDRATAVLSRYYALGGHHFLAFELGDVVRDVAASLRRVGRTGEAALLTEHLMSQVGDVLAHDTDLPAHEVNYEQSMVAPLVHLLLAAREIDPASVPDEELRRRLRWLTAFAAHQPDARVHHIPIRHWDDYWFGALRMWGDVFPHYWSVLSAAVFRAWPDGLLPAMETADLRRAADTILYANLINFASDGSASCAFVYPSCVNGQPAHVSDPLANDQDWALVYLLRTLTPGQ